MRIIKEIDMVTIDALLSMNKGIRDVIEEISNAEFIMQKRKDDDIEQLRTKLRQYKTALQEIFDEYLYTFDKDDQNRERITPEVLETISERLNKHRLSITDLSEIDRIVEKEPNPLTDSYDMDDEMDQQSDMDEEERVECILRGAMIVRYSLEQINKVAQLFVDHTLSDGSKKEELELIQQSLRRHKETMDYMVRKYIDADNLFKQEYSEVSFADANRLNDIMVFNNSLMIQASICGLKRLNEIPLALSKTAPSG